MGSQSNFVYWPSLVEIPVGRKWCRFTNAPKNFWSLSPKYGRQKHQILTTFFATSALDTAYLLKETSHRQTKMPVLIYNVYPKKLIYFRDFWLRNGWDPLAHCDPPYENSAFFVLASSPQQTAGKLWPVLCSGMSLQSRTSECRAGWSWALPCI